MAVYLDCAFHPRLLETDFLREGHHPVPSGATAEGGGNGALAFQGVVYNEMKGAMRYANAPEHPPLFLKLGGAHHGSIGMCFVCLVWGGGCCHIQRVNRRACH